MSNALLPGNCDEVKMLFLPNTILEISQRALDNHEGLFFHLINREMMEIIGSAEYAIIVQVA